MLKSFKVTFYQQLILELGVVEIYLYALHGGFVLKDLKYFLDSISDVENLVVFYEVLAIVCKDCVIENVMNKVVNKFGR